MSIQWIIHLQKRNYVLKYATWINLKNVVKQKPETKDHMLYNST